MNPLISVIIPVYNQEQFIGSTIESVLSQTYTNFELILWDDGSTDNTLQILKEYEKRDNRVSVFSEKNLGKAGALNSAVYFAKGELCAFLDHDDLMVHNRLEKQVAFHEANPEISATSSHCFYINEHGENRGVQAYNGLSTKVEVEEAILQKKIVLVAFTSIMIYKKAYQSIGGLSSRFWPCCDWEFVNRLLDNKLLLIIIQEPLMKYRVHKNMTTSKKYWETFVMSNYTMECIRLRRDGKPEISFDEFKKKYDEISWSSKLRRRAHGYAIIFHRNAGFSLHAKQYHKFIVKIAIASLLDRNYVLASVKKRLGKKY